MKKGSPLLAALAATLVIGVAASARADSAADRCGGTKTSATGKYSRSLFNCYAAALAANQSLSADCTDQAAARLTTEFSQAQAAGGCVTTDDEGAVESTLENTRSQVDAALAPAADDQARACASYKLRSAGRHVGARLRCYGSRGRRSIGPDGACLAKADAVLETAFAKAESAGGCTTVGDAASIEGLDDPGVEDVVRELSPVCGDGINGPSQACEVGDDAACPGLCTEKCICDLPPVCGDGVAKLPEECDDGNLVDGDGCSSSCKLENTSAICSGVPHTAGTKINAVFVSNDFTAPLFVAAPRLDPSRIFVVERAGTIRVVHLATNAVAPAPFLDISTLTTTGGERGLLSMAFDPGYATNGRFFISYTNLDGDLVIARYQVSANPELADASTRQQVLLVPHPGAAHHNGGQIQFGVDGYLYWSIGDDGDGGNSQDDASMLGKVLRLDVHHDTAPLATVPPTNPHYVDGTSDVEYVWAKGLRNPWRFSIDRATGDLYIGDVGANTWEEVDYQPASSLGGENYGWNIFEGSHCHKMTCPDPPTGFTMPVYEYQHGRPCAVMGGYVYRGCAMPDFAGTYFFSDLCAAFIRTFEIVGGAATDVTDRTDDARSSGAFFTGVVSWGEDARGELYIINGNNSIYRIEPE